MSTSVSDYRADQALQLIVGGLRGSAASKTTVQVPDSPTTLYDGALIVASALPRDIPFMFCRRSGPLLLEKFLPKPNRNQEEKPTAPFKTIHVTHDM